MTTDTDGTAVRIPAQQIGIDRELFHATDALEQEIKDDTARTEEKKQRLAAMQEELVDQFALAGVASIFLDDRAGSLGERVLAANADDSVTKERIIAALKAAGLPHLVEPETFNRSRLNGFVAELDRNGEDLPPALAEVIQVVRRPKIGFSKGTAAQRRAAARAAAAGEEPGGGESPA